MARTPGVILPTAYSKEDFEKLLRRVGEDAGFTPLEDFDFDEDEIKHYGVKGMKWGVIRKGAAKLVMPSDDAVKAQVVKGKAKLIGVHSLSNKDLQTLIRRMDLEVKFKELKTVQHNQSLLGKGASWTGRVLTEILVGTTISWLRRPGFSGVPRPHGGATSPVQAVATVGTRAIER